MGEKVYDEVRIFNSNMKDIYMKCELSIGDTFVTVKTGGVTGVYPTCNVTKVVIGKTK